ncbi:sulfatase-like hydrolase/transferase, partial [Verrucomicrobiales bacterium]|nr:sulfatase-like hydrolase/transferase [Verrucomicrobiales bacterium]
MRLIIHVLAVLVVTFVLVARGQSPNVVLIMADDLGYHDLSGYGHPKIKTPVLDQLAKDGVNLTKFYAGATVCTPSRMALLTGAYPSRLGWTKGVVGYLMNPGAGLQAEALTMAEVFRSEGYATGMTGKWHLGDESPMLPMEQGFEDTFYIKRSNNQTTELWRNTTLAEDPFDNRQLTKKFTNEAVRFIREQKASPFFLYVPFTAPHFPVQAHPDWKG